ncbi:MAG: hypothetical protein LBM56_01750 [Burkholderiaceae bacterium]|nr:hypothetical protein [Burkholderiaceae bacterium]
MTDRVVLAAVKIVIEPLFEANFKVFSYGFRPRKSAQQALREVYKWLNFKCHWVVDADLKSYFDTIPHDKLLLSVRTPAILVLRLSRTIQAVRSIGNRGRKESVWPPYTVVTLKEEDSRKAVCGKTARTV